MPKQNMQNDPNGHDQPVENRFTVTLTPDEIRFTECFAWQRYRRDQMDGNVAGMPDLDEAPKGVAAIDHLSGARPSAAEERSEAAGETGERPRRFRDRKYPMIVYEVFSDGRTIVKDYDDHGSVSYYEELEDRWAAEYFVRAWLSFKEIPWSGCR